MTQYELNREIARRTGETISTIQLMGFSPLEPNNPIEERREPFVVDWDQLDTIRFTECQL